MKKLKLYRCSVCGNLFCVIKDADVLPQCCGREMEEVTIHKEETMQEKHLPDVKTKGQTIEITIGEIEHPMTEDHYIEWILLETCQKLYAKKLTPKDRPIVCFTVGEDECFKAAYAYCNIHGLWLKKAD